MFGKKENKKEDMHIMMLILATARILKIDAKVMAKEMLNVKANTHYIADVTLESLKERKELDKDNGIDDSLKETMKHIQELAENLE